MPGNKLGIILQVRLGSTRLPNKVISDIAGKPMLWHIIERLKRIKLSDELVVATSYNNEDKQIVALVEGWGIRCFVGSENDVLDRFYQTAKKIRFKQILRATGDNPLVDPVEADRLISFHLRTFADYSSNKSEVGSGLPDGVGVEIFSFAALEKSWVDGKKEEYREHVNEYILQNPKCFHIQILQAARNKYAPHLRLTVDTRQDFNLIERIYQRFYTPGQIVSVGQAMRYLRHSKRI